MLKQYSRVITLFALTLVLLAVSLGRAALPADAHAASVNYTTSSTTATLENIAGSWNTFLGGGGSDAAIGIAVDGSGNVYISGSSAATWGSPVRAYAGGKDAFVAKLDSSGNLIWNTFLGSSSDDGGYNNLAIDGSGNVYVTGASAASWGNPLQAFAGGGGDAFVAKLDTSGLLIWNTFLGGSGNDESRSIAVDGANNIYVSGASIATWGNPMRAYTAGNYDGFATKLNSSGTLVWNTFLGGSNFDVTNYITVDGNGNVYVAGSSWSSTWDTPVRPFASSVDGFAVKLSPTGTLVWNTFLGGNGVDYSQGIAVDTIGNVYLTGYSEATWGSPVRAYTSGGDAFSAKLNSSGSLLWNTFLGASGFDFSNGIVVDDSGIYVSGHSATTWGSPSLNYTALDDAFVAKLDSSGAVILNAFLGGSGHDYGVGIAMDGSRNIYMTGYSEATWGSPVRAQTAGDYDAFATKIDLFANLGSWSLAGNMATTRFNQGLALLPNGKVLAAAGQQSDMIALASSELYDPATRSWSPTGNLNTARIWFGNVVRLNNGKVLIAGGTDSSGYGDFASAELYDPATGLWSFTGSLHTPRRGATLTLLDDGRVLAVGGAHGLPDGNRFLASAELYDPTTGLWTYTGSLSIARDSHNAVKLADGRVMIFAGEGPWYVFGKTTEVYSPTTGIWTQVGDINFGHRAASAILLDDGSVLAAGGYDGSGVYTTTELFDPATGTWSVTTPMNVARAAGDGNLMRLPNGKILIVGGGGNTSFLNSTEIFDPISRTWSLDASLHENRAAQRTVQLANNDLLTVGGLVLASSETYSLSENIILPQIVSIVRSDLSPTSAVSVNFTVTFSKSVMGVAVSDFALTATGTISGESVIGVSGGPTTYTIGINTGNGDGALRLDVPAGATVTDLAGNPLAGLPYTTGDSYVMDKTAPTVVSSVRLNSNPTSAASLDFYVIFSEWVTGVDMSDFTLTTTGITGTSITEITGSGTTYTVTVNTGSNDGTLRLDVVDDDTILDTVLKSLGGAGIGNGNFTSGETYTIDKTPPDTQINSKPAGLSNSTSAAFSFSSAGGSATFECSLDSATYAVCTSPHNYSGLAEGSHTFAVRATDLAGNVDVTPAAYTWTIDTAAPTIIYYVKPIASGTGDCQSWDNACTLQTALTNTISVDEIWVAAGMYKPTMGTDRNATFQLKDNLAVYGGFVGTETARSQRNPATNVITLSGDLNGDDVGFTNNSENVYHVVNGANNATLDGFTITAGNANDVFPNDSGGGMYNDSSSPTLASITFISNSATYGGGMENDSSNPTLTNVAFRGNSAAHGGGMYNFFNSNPILTSVTFSGNSATNNNGGGMVNDTNSNPMLTGVTFISNSATYGGGMHNYSSRPTLTSVTFVSNSATYGGGMYNYFSGNPMITSATFISNSATYGGGMYNDTNSNPTLTNVTFTNNSSINYGGGMRNFSSSDPTLTNVTFTNNSAIDGGGMANSTSSNPTLMSVTFSGNSATNGGGMLNWSSSPTLTGVTFSDNTATNGGGMENYSDSGPMLTNITFISNSAAIGGGMLNMTSSPTLTNITFSGNSATNYGGGLTNIYTSSPQIRNTIFWNNTAITIGAQIYNYDAGSIPSVSDSVAQGGCSVGSVCTNLITANPNLGTLGDYGGSTQTIPLLANSSAVDTGNDTTCATHDQRGIPRPQGAHCDIGAYEVVIPPHADFSASPLAGLMPLTVNFTNTSTGDYVAAAWNFGDGATGTLLNPTHVYTQSGKFTVTLMISGSGGINAITRTNYITAYAQVHALFDAVPLEGSVPFTVGFTNTSTGDFTDVLWDFDDGVTSTLLNPTHTYSLDGRYTTTLTISNPFDASTAQQAIVAHTPHATASPNALQVTLNPNDVAMRTLQVGNSGDADLAWNLAAVPSNGWLSISPISGTVLPQSSAGLTVTFDVHSLSAGGYTTTLLIASNDLINKLIAVPVTLTIVSAPIPDIRLNPPTLAMTLTTGDAGLRNLAIGNVGTGNLTWSLAEIPSVGWLNAAPLTGTLSLSTSNDVAVNFNAAGLSAGIYSTTLRVTSNDPDQPQVDVPVTLFVSAGCVPVSAINLTRAPAGEVFTGDAIHFTANATGTVPFTYTWTVNAAPVGSNLNTLDHVFDSTGAYTVGVTIANACGQNNATLPILVQARSGNQPDLSTSYKTVNFANVESGDTLTYTLVLRNRSAITATAHITDPIPVHTAYVVGSARASDGSPITFDSGQLIWSGAVISGTPVIIAYAVTMLSAPIGTAIINTAQLNDGWGNISVLEARSTYNPGFSLSIDDGALYTNIPTITLNLTWDAVIGIDSMKISNDGGFGTGGNTTVWLPVTTTYNGWVMSTYGDWRLPRTVYAKFRDINGTQFGPIQDDIIYDPIVPSTPTVQIIMPSTLQYAAALNMPNVIVRITASDDNSGVGVIQISNTPDFTQATEYVATGSTTDITWTPQSSGKVYVRVIDRAGNLSAETLATTHFIVYLPLVSRSH